MSQKPDFEQPIFPPGAVATLTGISTDAQRDLRHKGFLTNYGTASGGGRWRYSFRDVIAFAASAWLMNTKFQRHDSCAVAWTEAPVMFGFLRGADVPAMPYRFVAFLHDYQVSDGMGLGGTVVEHYRSLSEVERGASFGRADLLDLKFMASRLPSDVKDIAEDYEIN